MGEHEIHIQKQYRKLPKQEGYAMIHLCNIKYNTKFKSSTVECVNCGDKEDKNG